MLTYFTIFLMLLLTATVSNAKSAGHHAHVHGSAIVNIAFDNGTAGLVQITAPSESIYGFEYEPRSAQEKVAQAEGLKKIETKISEMIIFEKKAACTFQKIKIKVSAEKDEPAHREVAAEFAVRCGKTIAGTKLSFAFTKVFARIKEIKGQVLTSNVQSEIDIDNDKGEIAL